MLLLHCISFNCIIELLVTSWMDLSNHLTLLICLCLHITVNSKRLLLCVTGLRRKTVNFYGLTRFAIVTKILRRRIFLRVTFSLIEVVNTRIILITRVWVHVSSLRVDKIVVASTQMWMRLHICLWSDSQVILSQVKISSLKHFCSNNSYNRCRVNSLEKEVDHLQITGTFLVLEQNLKIQNFNLCYILEWSQLLEAAANLFKKS